MSSNRSVQLGSRIGGNHLHGNIESSTFRKTLTAVLLEPIGLRLSLAGRLDPESNQAVSRWMADHLSLATIGCPDRSALARLEEEVLSLLAPPLNLMGMVRTPAIRALEHCVLAARWLAQQPWAASSGPS